MNLPAIALLALGILQYAGELLALSGANSTGRKVVLFAAATAASPVPDLLPCRHGLDPYATRIQIEYELSNGQSQLLHLTPEIMQRIPGPSARRNVVLNVLANGPALLTEDATRPMLDSIIGHTLTGGAPIVSELNAGNFNRGIARRIRYEPRWPDAKTASWPRVIEVNRE